MSLNCVYHICFYIIRQYFSFFIINTNRKGRCYFWNKQIFEENYFF
jgi:hypothetical protein